MVGPLPLHFFCRCWWQLRHSCILLLYLAISLSLFRWNSSVDDCPSLSGTQSLRGHRCRHSPSQWMVAPSLSSCLLVISPKCWSPSFAIGAIRPWSPTGDFRRGSSRHSLWGGLRLGCFSLLGFGPSLPPRLRWRCAAALLTLLDSDDHAPDGVTLTQQLLLIRPHIKIPNSLRI